MQSLKSTKAIMAAAVFMFGITAMQPVFAKDACATVLCMYGAVTGQGGGSSCHGPIKDYFKIIKFDWKGINWRKTLKARSSFLSSCPAEGIGGQIGKIDKVFGKAFGL